MDFVGHVGLEEVPRGLHRREVDPAQEAGAVHPVAGGDVGRGDSQPRLDVEVSGAREDLAGLGPADHLSPAHVARADDQIRVVAHARAFEQKRKLLRPVRAVGVHLDDVRVVASHRPVESRQVGLAEPFLARPVQDVDGAVVFGDPVGQVARPVRRVVVDDEDVRVRNGRADPGHDRFEGLNLVVSRNDDENLHRPPFSLRLPFPPGRLRPCANASPPRAAPAR